VDCLKDFAEIAQALVTCAAIVVGGAWTWKLYVRQRLSHARAGLDLGIYHVILPDGKWLIHASLRIANTGNVMLRLKKAELRLRQVVPIPEELEDVVRGECDPVPKGDTEIKWPAIVNREWTWEEGQFEIEPGENDSIHADLVLDSKVQVIQFYSFVGNPTKKRPDLGWTDTQMHELGSNEKGKLMNDREDSKKQDPAETNERQERMQKQQQPQQPQQPQQRQQPQQQPQQKKPENKQDEE